MSKFEIIDNYQTNSGQRKEFHVFISKVFPSISFEKWYELGFWIPKFRPFSIFKNGKIISNACASEMDIILNGKKLKAIQIGAVGTLEEHRNRGLSRLIMEHIIEKYENSCDFFFLHANETVLKFYPKFGFKEFKEYSFINSSRIPDGNFRAIKLNLDSPKDLELIMNYLKKRINITEIFGAEEYFTITMWYLINIYHDSIYFLEEHNAIIIANVEDDILNIIDVIHTEEININDVLPCIIPPTKINSIKFFFSPDKLNFYYDDAIETNTGLFIKGLTEISKIPFRYPETAVT